MFPVGNESAGAFQWGKHTWKLLEKNALAGALQQQDKLCKTHSSPDTQERQLVAHHEAHVAGWCLPRAGLALQQDGWCMRDGTQRAALWEDPNPAQGQSRVGAISEHKATHGAGAGAPCAHPAAALGRLLLVPPAELPPAKAGRQPRDPSHRGDEKQQEAASWWRGGKRKRRHFRLLLTTGLTVAPSEKSFQT